MDNVSIDGIDIMKRSIEGHGATADPRGRMARGT